MNRHTIPPSEQQRIIFFHPDLGIGGAERLIIDAAVGLQELGHSVRIYTSHCDPDHCFEEARDDKLTFELVLGPASKGTLDVRVRGNTVVPPSLFSHRFVILCAILRQLHLLIHITLFTSELHAYNPTVFFVDQLSAGLIFLRLLCPTVPTLFYCHFPDKLLARGRQNWVKSLYRVPFDALERWSTGLADKVVVNSYFTKRVFRDAFPGLAVGEGQEKKREMERVKRVGVKKLSVVYPCVRLSEFNEGSCEKLTNLDGGEGLFGAKRIILSINRFEEKKDISLAIRAFSILDKSLRNNVRLVIAGGYDPRLLENVTYHNQLLALCSDLDLATFTACASAAITSTATKHLNQETDHSFKYLSSIPHDASVVFLLSVPTQLKRRLLYQASLLVYTPRGEHFGIVPLEAMAAGIPVLAANQGGPVESIVEGTTGWLRDPDVVEDWTHVMNEVLKASNSNDANTKPKEMGEAGRERVRTEFSREKMTKRLDEELKELRSMNSEERKPFSNDKVILIGIVGFVMLAALPWFVMRAYVQ